MPGSPFRRDRSPSVAHDAADPRLRARRLRLCRAARKRDGRTAVERRSSERTRLERAATLVEYVLFMSLFLMVAGGAVGAMNDGAQQYFSASAERIGQPVNHDRSVEAPNPPGGGGPVGPIDWDIPSTVPNTATPPTTQIPPTTPPTPPVVTPPADLDPPPPADDPSDPGA